MAKGFIAIDINKNVFEYSKAGIENIKILHQNQGVSKNWLYGKIEDKNELLKKVVTTSDAQKAVEENAILKQRISELEADNKGAKSTKKSDNTEK